MLTKGSDQLEFVTDRAGRRWEYQLLRAGGIELGRLRAQLRRLAAEGWEVDGAYGALEQQNAGGAGMDSELHVWLRRPLAADKPAQLSALFMAAA